MEQVINFYLNNELINPPFNWRELEINVNYDKDSPSNQININNWRFVNENATIINTWKNSSPGVFEGVPFRIEVEKDGNISRIFDGYLDLTDRPRLSCNEIEITAKEKLKIDFLNDVADGFTFQYLFEEIKSITKEDFIFVPYVINSVPDYKDAALATISAFVVSKELTQAINDLTALLTEAANPFEATALSRAALYVIYLSLLIVTLIKLLKDIILLIIQPVKYHAGMTVKKQLEKGAEYLGLTFKSSIFDGVYKDLIIIPQKQFNPVSKEEPSVLGFLTPNKNEQIGYYKGTFGELLRAVKTMFNAKIIITDNKELIIERVDYNLNAGIYQIPPIEQNFYTINADEMRANYLIEFATDLIDKNTIQDYKGTSYQVILQPATFGENRLFKGFENIAVPFALAKRKTGLTVPEKIVNGLIKSVGAILGALVKTINAIIKIFNKIVKLLNKIIKALKTININLNIQLQPIKPLPPPDFGKSIENRLGMLKLETDFINIPKILILEQGTEPKKNKITAQNDILVSAKYLYDNFHFVNSFYPTPEKPNGAQFEIKSVENVPFCYEDYLKVKNNNVILDSENNQGFLEALDWNIWQEKANITYRINKLYTSNLIQKTYEPDGK